VDKGNSVGSPGGGAFPHGDNTSEMLARAEVDTVWQAGQKQRSCSRRRLTGRKTKVPLRCRTTGAGRSMCAPPGLLPSSQPGRAKLSQSITVGKQIYSSSLERSDDSSHTSS